MARLHWHVDDLAARGYDQHLQEMTMCGIAGSWGNTDVKAVKSMMDDLVHRGPDDAGVCVQQDQAAFGHRRLAIMDPESGAQPFQQDTRALISNGEIYNWKTLKAELEQGALATGTNLEFRTTSDAEVAFHLLKQQGQQGVKELDGMFALAFAHNDDIVLARDPIGIKPLYYVQADDALYFASEMKALTRFNTPIDTLEPGTIYSSQQGKTRFYDVPFYCSDNAQDSELSATTTNKPMLDNAQDAITAVRDSLEQAVVKRLMSDVPLGAFLSGGLDSSIIAAIATKHLGHLKTFSVGIEGSPDLAAAKYVAQYLGTEHHEYVFTADEVRAAFGEVIYALESFDQDLVRSVIPTHFTSRLAAEHVKVILTGEGADELFAGYTYYKNYTDMNALQQELHRSICNMHNVNLQRVDRITMLHSVEGRVPFLDTNVIDVAMRIPAALKLRAHTQSGPKVEKWVLRKAFEDMLPENIVWRDKAQFDEGSGTTDMLADIIAEETAKFDSHAFRQKRPEAALRSPEEAYYYSMFEYAFEAPQLLLPNIGRWAQ
ncbi:MAG: asparagine synthase B [Deinococcota bacterium]